MGVAYAIALGALAGGLVAFAASLAHRAFNRRVDPDMPRIRLEIIGTTLGAVAGGVAGAFAPLPMAVLAGGLSPLVIPPLVIVLGSPFRPSRLD